jgi:hypothetical protein
MYILQRRLQVLTLLLYLNIVLSLNSECLQYFMCLGKYVRFAITGKVLLLYGEEHLNY